jgi:hypothetical protein
MLCAVLIGAVTVCAWAVKESSLPPNLSGTWNIDIFKSANLPYSHIVVSQDELRVHFDCYQGKKLITAETFVLDGRERPRYENNITRAYSRAKFEKRQLVITTHVITDQTGTQGYVEEDRWVLSPDGSVLTYKPSDGRNVIYVRRKEPAGSTAEPDHQASGNSEQKYISDQK